MGKMIATKQMTAEVVSLPMIVVITQHVAVAKWGNHIDSSSATPAALSLDVAFLSRYHQTRSQLPKEVALHRYCEQASEIHLQHLFSFPFFSSLSLPTLPLLRHQHQETKLTFGFVAQ